VTRHPMATNRPWIDDTGLTQLCLCSSCQWDISEDND